MMDTFQIEWLPGSGIVHGKILPDFPIRRDVREAGNMLRVMLDQAKEPVPYILDVIEIRMDFGEMIYAMADLTKGEGAVWRHPMLKEMIVITNSSMVRLGVNSLRQMQYGGLKTAAFSTLEEAFKHLSYNPASYQAAAA
jgi:hypothetical protein